MYVPFPFQGKEPKGRSKLMYNVIIVSNTIKMSSIVVSLLSDPVSVPFPDSGFRIPDSFFSIRPSVKSRLLLILARDRG